MKRVKLIVSGKVQEVFYRNHIKKAAASFSVKGYVRNLPNGTVEVLAEGNELEVEKLISECRKGSFIARVDNVEIINEKPTGEFEDFQIRF